MLVKEVSSSTQLDLHQLACEAEKDQGLFPLSLHELCVSLVSVQALPTAECCAHRTEQQEHGLLTKHQLLTNPRLFEDLKTPELFAAHGALRVQGFFFILA